MRRPGQPRAQCARSGAASRPPARAAAGIVTLTFSCVRFAITASSDATAASIISAAAHSSRVARMFTMASTARHSRSRRPVHDGDLVVVLQPPVAEGFRRCYRHPPCRRATVQRPVARRCSRFRIHVGCRPPSRPDLLVPDRWHGLESVDDADDPAVRARPLRRRPPYRKQQTGRSPRGRRLRECRPVKR